MLTFNLIHAKKPTSCSPSDAFGTPSVDGEMNTRGKHEGHPNSCGLREDLRELRVASGKRKIQNEPEGHTKATRSDPKATRRPHGGHTKVPEDTRTPNIGKSIGNSLTRQRFFRLSRCFSRRLKNAPEGPPEGLGRPPE